MVGRKTCLVDWRSAICHSRRDAHPSVCVPDNTGGANDKRDGLRPYVWELPLWSVIAHRGNGTLLILLKLYYVSPDGVL